MQIGVFGNPDSWYVNELVRAGAGRGHVIHRLLFSQLRSHIRDGSLQQYSGDTDLHQLQAVVVRTMPPGTLEQVVARMDLLTGLLDRGLTVLNSPRALECAVDKYLTTQKLAIAGVSVPETFVCEDADSALAAFDLLGGDVVVKPIFGAEGRGIIRVSDPEIGLRAFRTLERLGAVLYVQRFVRSPGFDLRLLLLDGQLLGAMKRFPRSGDFRANISQNGTAQPHVPTDTELNLAREAAVITGCLFAGVDLMYNEEGQPLVIEVNAVPGWKGLQAVCSSCIPERLFQWLEDRVA